MISTLSLHLNKSELSKIASKNQFTGKEDCIYNTYQALEPLLRPVVHYDVLVRNEDFPYIEYEHYAVVIASLGSFVDDLQELYEKAGEHLHSYAIECISLKLLEKMYKHLEHQFSSENHKWVQEYHFLGDRYPLEKMKDIFRWLNPPDIVYNDAYLLLPKKTSVYINELGDTKKESCNICKFCQNHVCPNRKKDNHRMEYSYGYQRIFKK